MFNVDPSTATISNWSIIDLEWAVIDRTTPHAEYTSVYQSYVGQLLPALEAAIGASPVGTLADMLTRVASVLGTDLFHEGRMWEDDAYVQRRWLLTPPVEAVTAAESLANLARDVEGLGNVPLSLSSGDIARILAGIMRSARPVGNEV